MQMRGFFALAMTALFVAMALATPSGAVNATTGAQLTTTGVSANVTATTGAAAAPASGAGGQNVDLALIMADGSTNGRTDPAFPAHALPIGFWAMAVWNGWMPESDLHHMIWVAKNKLAAANFPWRLVYGR